MPDQKFVINFYKHDLAELATHAGLTAEMKMRSANDALFATYWETTRLWKVEARYLHITPEDYSDFQRAVLDPKHGVLSWIRTQW